MRIGKREIGRVCRAAAVGLVKRAPATVYALAFALMATACGSGSADSKSPESAQGKSTAVDTSTATGQSAGGARRARVVILGTSLTAGLGLDPADAYPAVLQSLADSAGYKVSIVNAGLSGETSAGALRRAAWVLDQPADAVVLEVGANDGLRGVNPSDTQANIEALVDKIVAKFKPDRVVLVQMEAPPNFGRDYTTKFHTAYVTAAKNKNILLAPFLLDSVAAISTLNQNDGIHPNKAGARIVARNMFRALTPLFASLSTGPSAQ